MADDKESKKDDYAHDLRATGEQCLLCSRRRQCRGFPFVYIGKYRRFATCKKAHFRTDDELEQFIKIIDNEMELIRNSDPKDIKISPALAQKQFDAQDTVCAGFLNLTEYTQCNQTCPGLLHIIDSDKKQVNFCCGSHLARYLMRTHCSRYHTVQKKARIK